MIGSRNPYRDRVPSLFRWTNANDMVPNGLPDALFTKTQLWVLAVLYGQNSSTGYGPRLKWEI
jgi:hypothetical protein